MTRRRGVVTCGLVAALLLAGAAFAQPGRGPISGGSGGGGGVSGLTACDNGVALADNAVLRANGTDECQGATTTLTDAGDLNLDGDGTGVLTSANFPASSTDNAIARFDSTTGKLLQDSAVTIDDSNVVSGVTQLNVDNLRLDGNTLSSTDTNGNIILDPNGSGRVQVNLSSPDSSISLQVASDADNLVSLNGSATANYNVVRFERNSANKWFIGLAKDADLPTYAGDFVVYDYSGTPGVRLGISDSSGNVTIPTGALLTKQLVEANTAGSGAPNVLVGTESNTLLTNEGATAANYHTLPTAVAGDQFIFCVQDSDGMRVVAASGDTIRVIDKVTAAAGYIESTTIGSCWTGKAINATEWFTTAITGTWTDGTWSYDDTSLTTP